MIGTQTGWMAVYNRSHNFLLPRRIANTDVCDGNKIRRKRYRAPKKTKEKYV